MRANRQKANYEPEEITNLQAHRGCHGHQGYKPMHFGAGNTARNCDPNHQGCRRNQTRTANRCPSANPTSMQMIKNIMLAEWFLG